jgi:hypothetical protein
VPALVRRLEECCPPELVVAAVAGDADVSRAGIARGGFPGWSARTALSCYKSMISVTCMEDQCRELDLSCVISSTCQRV